jgi:hypothetical protein
VERYVNNIRETARSLTTIYCMTRGGNPLIFAFFGVKLTRIVGTGMGEGMSERGGFGKLHRAKLIMRGKDKCTLKYYI